MKKISKLLPILTILALLPSFNTANAKENSMQTNNKNLKLATFAGGCFWCIEPAFDSLDGVTSTIVGYSGGEEADAKYELVSAKKTEHKEAIQIEYDESKVSFKQLLERFMRNIDPSDNAGQFADKGPQYRTSIFYHDEAQKQQAEEYFKELKENMKFKYPIYTIIEPYKNFFPAEEYHQEYYKKNPMRYNAYKYGSGRVDRLKEVWGEEK